LLLPLRQGDALKTERQSCALNYLPYISNQYRTHLGSIIYAIANLFNISLTKQRLSFVVAFLRVLSKFLTKLLHLSIQELLLSITHLALAGTNPDNPLACFSAFKGFGDSSN
jgi:hypothetical protein